MISPYGKYFLKQPIRVISKDLLVLLKYTKPLDNIPFEEQDLIFSCRLDNGNSNYELSVITDKQLKFLENNYNYVTIDSRGIPTFKVKGS